jgi:hypothetical protein
VEYDNKFEMPKLFNQNDMTKRLFEDAFDAI